MIGGVHRPGASPLHRLPAGPKLAALFLAGTLLFFVGPPLGIGAALGGVLALYRLAGFSLRLAVDELRPALAVVVLVALAQGFVAGWAAGLAAGGRLVTLLLLAGLVTLTTPASAMIAALERGLGLLRPFGVRPRAAGLALSLALRFVPVIARVAEEVREAQRARGLERSLFALAVPLIVRSLRMADEVADAVEARGFDPAED